MATKRIVVLAHSIKKQARCLAGREVHEVDGEYTFGKWVRPVSHESEGELLPQHYRLSDGGEAQVLDIVDVPVVGPTQDRGQPENWRLVEGAKWRKIGQFSQRDLRRLTEIPVDLWWDHGAWPDKIQVEEQARRRPQTSLVLIQPRGLYARIGSKSIQDDKGKVREKKKRLLCFRYGQRDYELSVTDDRFTGELPFGSDRLLCVSLTPPFNGYHYKKWWPGSST